MWKETAGSRPREIAVCEFDLKLHIKVRKNIIHRLFIPMELRTRINNALVCP